MSEYEVTSELYHMYIRYTHVNIDIPLYVYLVIEIQIHYAISKQCGTKQDKANVCHHQVSCFNNFSPGLPVYDL